MDGYDIGPELNNSVKTTDDERDFFCKESAPGLSSVHNGYENTERGNGEKRTQMP